MAAEAAAANCNGPKTIALSRKATSGIWESCSRSSPKLPFKCTSDSDKNFPGKASSLILIKRKKKPRPFFSPLDPYGGHQVYIVTYPFLPNSGSCCSGRGRPLFNPFDVIDDASASLDDFEPELRLIFKRILKKEQSTRIRGLQEFRQWLENCTEIEFTKVHGLFAKIYRQGTEDEERSIRELVNLCLQTVVKKNKKWLSPIFKEIMYAWIGSFADAGSISKIAKASFQACFSESRYPEICRMAILTTIPEALSIRSKDLPTINRVQAFSNLLFVTSFADAETLKRMKAEVSFRAIVGINLALVDTSVKTVAYQFYRLALHKRVLQREELLTTAFFKSLLGDLSSAAAPEALVLLYDYETPAKDMISEIASTIKSNLPTEINESIIVDLVPLLKHLPSSLRTSTLWSVLTEKRILDSERLVRIWTLFASCCFEEEFLESEYCSKLLYPNIINESVRSRVIEKMASINKKVLERAFLGLLKSPTIEPNHKLQLALELAPFINDDTVFDRQELTSMMRELSPSWQSRLITHMLKNPKETLLHKLLLEATSDTLDFVAICSSADMSTRRENKVLELLASKVQRQLEEMSIDEKIKTYVTTARFGTVSIDSSTAIYALEHLDPNSAQVVMAYFGEAFWNHFGKEFIVEPKTVHLLRGLAKEAILTSHETKIAALFMLIEFLQGTLRSTKDILLAVDCLFKVDSSLHEVLVDELLTVDYSLNHKIMEMLCSAFPKVLDSMRQHVTLTTVALTKYPVLLPNSPVTAGVWTRDISFLGVLAPLLRHAARNKDMTRREDILLYNAFILCLQEEQQFRSLEEHSTATLPDTIPLSDVDIGEMAHTEGFYLLAAGDAGASISLRKLLSHETPLSFSVLPVIEDDADKTGLLETAILTCDRWLKALAARYTWNKSEYYQLLSEHDMSLAVVKRGGCAQGILTDFMNAAYTKGLIDKEEYWDQHTELCEKLVANLKEFWKDSSNRLTYHSVIYSTLKLFNLPQTNNVIMRHLEFVFEGFKLFAMEPTLPVFGNVLRQFVHILDTCCDHPQLLNFVSDNELFAILLGSRHLSVKLAIRNAILFRVDDFLTKAKHKIESLASINDSLDLNGLVLVPSEPLLMILEGSEEGTSNVNVIFALEIFLALAEGSKEESRLFAAYAEFFREKVASRYLLYLCKYLCWDTDFPVDLGRMEITMPVLGAVEFNDLTPFAANVLFRSFKAFPMAVRSWYDELSKEWSSRVLKYTTQFLSPLLIERELARVRKVSLEPVKLRIIRSSTTCAIQVNYHLEEFQLSYVLTIPLSYPLKPVTVQGDDQQQRLGVSASKWRTWLLSVQSLLAQNLAIVEAIRQWKSNAEKVLQGIEPCSVCYCVLQPSDRSLPGPSCKTCRNKFHSMCLYRWFKTSGQATCPMCRSLF